MYREKKKKGKLYKFDSVTHLAYRFGKPKNQWFSWTLTHCHRPRTCQHWVYCSATRIPNRRRRPALFWRPLPWYNRTGQLTLGVTNTNLLTYLLVLAAIMCNGRWRCSRPELTLRQSPLDQTHRCLASMTRQNFKAESFSSQAVGTYDSHEASPLRLLLVLAVAGPFGLDCVSESVPVCWLTYYVCFS